MRHHFINASRLVSLVLLVSAVIVSSCGDAKENAHADWSEARQQKEARGQELLAASRRALAAKDYAAAREHIMTLRRDCDIAFTARNEGILLLDSIDLQQALDGMVAADSLQQTASAPADSTRAVIEEYTQRIKFFRRKLEHDKKEARSNE